MVDHWTEDALNLLKEKAKSFVPREKIPVSAQGGPTRGIIFYTDNRLSLRVASRVQKQLNKISKERGIPIVSASLKPMSFGDKNIHIKMERGYEAYFHQIIAALEASTAEIIYFCEHDVIYHPSHFDFIPPEKDRFYYNQNWWKIRDDGFAAHWDADQVSGLVCYRDAALAWYKDKLAAFKRDDFDRKFEPMSGDKKMAVSWKSEFPNIDIRHGNTLTKSKWSIDDFRDKKTAVNFATSTVDKIPGWVGLRGLLSWLQ